jgi:hypothetical protein
VSQKELMTNVAVPLVVGFLSVVGSIWAFSSSLATKADAKEIAVAVVIDRNQAVVERLASLEAKMDILLRRGGRGD